MLKQLQNGRLAAIFFILCISVPTTQAQSISLQTQAISNKGILTDDYWRGQPFETTSRKVIGYIDTSLKADWVMRDRTYFVERRKVQTFVGNTNALSMAANDELNTSDLATGNYPIKAELRQFQWDAVGTRLQGQLQNERTTWSVEPKFAKLRSFKSGEGAADLTIGATQSELTGQVHRQSGQSYGPLTNSKTMDMGYGASVDAALVSKFEGLHFEATMQNVFSYFQVTSGYFSDRSYQVIKGQDGIKFSQTPSITGAYGQRNLTYHVPRIYRLGLSSQQDQGLSGGVLGVDTHAMPWLGWTQPFGQQMLQATTYGFDNLTLAYRYHNIMASGLSAGLSLSSGLKGKPYAQIQFIKLNF